jgi:hypothetical protein
MTAAARFAHAARTSMTSPVWQGISLAPFEPIAALRVIEDLDPIDRLEVQLGGIQPTPGEMLRQFIIQQAGGAHLQIVYAHRTEGGAEPFAILGVAEALASCTGSAALIARDHAAWARPLRHLCAGLRADLPAAMAAAGFRRIEARCWSGHPTAQRLLRGIGFAFETELHGFGLSETHWLQFAIVPEKGT